MYEIQRIIKAGEKAGNLKWNAPWPSVTAWELNVSYYKGKLIQLKRMKHGAGFSKW